VGGALSLRVATPQDHGLMAGAHLPMGLDGEMPGDQRMDDALAVRFDATPEGKAADLIGRAVLRLRVTCDRPRAFVHARLCDVARDGASRRIAHGMLNLCHRNGMDAPAPVPVGVPFDLTIPLDAMAHRIAAGHRLRLALATTCWPFPWPSPEAATVAVLSGTLKVPVVPGGPGGRAAPAPTGAPPWAHRRLTPARAARRIARDLIGGTVALVVEDDGGDREDAAHGLIAGSGVVERWTIRPDDPPLAEMHSVRDQRLARGDRQVRTRAETRMTGTRDALLIGSRRTAWEGGTAVFDRADEDRVPRTWV
jgi:hypothetical protein